MRRRERGSAVITVVLVVLVLTMVGLASLIYMSLEQNLTLSDRLAKEALYMSEVGLRTGEAYVASVSLGQINTLLSLHYPSVSDDWSLIPPSPEECEGTAFLGAILQNPTTGVTYHAFKPTFYTAPTGYYAMFSLYLRNNPDDPSGNPLDDQDNRVRLVAVGEVYRGDPPVAGVIQAGSVLVARKILEEELGTGVFTGYTGQKGGSASGANSGFFK